MSVNLHIKRSVALLSLKPARILGLGILLFTGAVSAAPWMEPDDKRLRHHIQLLADTNLISVPVNTWPLMWLDIIDEVRLARTKSPSPNQSRAINYVLAAFARQSRSSQVEFVGRAGEQYRPIQGYGDLGREKQQTYLGVEFVGEGIAGRLRIHRIDDPTDGDTNRLDGSYLSGLWGNWVFTAGSLDRWWGPGWETGLILSSNARPMPALSIQRHASTAFSSPWLSWIGPWQFASFAGKLDDPRDVNDAYLFGAKFSFKPVDWLEFGIARTAQWGGEGRPQDGSSLWNLILGRDNQGSQGISQSNEPGNQLGGFDWRVSIPGSVPVGIYGEIVGEDESGYQPSKRVTTLGFDLVFSLPNSDLRMVAEYSDTATQRLDDGDPRYNTAYEHSIYTSGYRYHGRSIAASADNDSRVSTLAGLWQIDASQSLNTTIKWLELNSDGNGRAFPDGNSVARGRSNGWYADVDYRINLDSVEISLSYTHYDGELQIRNLDTGDDTVELGLAFRW